MMLPILGLSALPSAGRRGATTATAPFIGEAAGAIQQIGRLLRQTF